MYLKEKFLIGLLVYSVSWLFTKYFAKEEEKIPLALFATLQGLSGVWVFIILAKDAAFLTGLAFLVLMLIGVISYLLEGFGHKPSKRFDLYSLLIAFVCAIICLLCWLFG